MGHAGGRAVVAGGDDAMVFDEDGADLAAQAVGAFGDDVGDLHEIGVPVWALVHGGFLLWVRDVVDFMVACVGVGCNPGGKCRGMVECVVGLCYNEEKWQIMRTISTVNDK